MSKRSKASDNGAMLDLWRPPEGAGDPVGCLATTYTFAPGLFDEQCLARFLEIESEPNREDLAFLLERECRLGGVYAGVLVDHTQAGVEHSLRWDVLPVRLQGGKQHAKLSLLAWNRHVRIIVTSANLSEPGYRTNYEVVSTIELTPAACDADILADAITFLRTLIQLVPAASYQPPEVRRAEKFLADVERQVRAWLPVRRRGPVRQKLVFTLPAVGDDAARSSMDDAVAACRARGASPHEAWVASPFFDTNEETSRVTAALCKGMARGRKRELWLCLPAIRDETDSHKPRLAAPKSLLLTPPAYQANVNVELLPEQDRDKNRRPWHAKMLGLLADEYSAIMIGSSNFTGAGMGVGHYRNVEANLLTIVDREAYSRDIARVESVCPEMEAVTDPGSAEWLGARPELEEEQQATSPPLPAGFLSATYRAGDARRIVVRLDPLKLPEEWQIRSCGHEGIELLSVSSWRKSREKSVIEIAWPALQPPEKLLVQWGEDEAFLTINIEDSRELPPPAQLQDMSADDMLWILAAADPSAAFRAWAKRQQPADLFDSELDSATPIDLDPLRHYDLQATFLHRIRRRARVLAQLRSNLQRDVLGRQALEWRLRGLIGIEPLAERLVRAFVNANGSADEALLTLADFFIVLREVDYQPSDGALPRPEFEKIFRPFLSELAGKLSQQIKPHQERISDELVKFWERVVEQCRR